MKEKSIEKILQSQIWLNVVLLVILLIKKIEPILSVCLGILILALLIFKKKRISQILNVLCLPVVFMETYSRVANSLLKSFPQFIIGIYIIYFLGMLGILIPVVIRDYGKINKAWLRLLSTMWLIISLFSVRLISIDKYPFLIGLNDSAIMFAFMFAIYAYIVIKDWGYNFCFNLKVKSKNSKYFIASFLIILFSVWFIFFNSFIFMAREWNEVLWNWDFSLINPLQSAVFTNKWQVYFTAVEAGVLEETARYVFILTLLVMFKNKHWQLEFTILGSSLIFALFHLSNIFSKGRTIEDVAYQILYAFGIGCLLGTLYLLTGKLWLSILIHAGADFFAFSQTPLALAGASAFADCSNPRFIISFILMIVSFSASVIFWFSCRNIIKQNAKKIMMPNH